MTNIIARIGAYNKFGSKLGLSRMEGLLARLGDPHKGLRVLHVAGTNGKGSVSKYLYEVLRAAGYSTGVYISPFIEVFNERMQMDGANISDEALERIGDRVIRAAEEMVAAGEESPTEFEVVTAIAFVWFAEQQADFVVLEVGLGGRGDSTNVVSDPLVCMITSIGWDHMDRLGNTLGKIAGEKAGIIKPGIPVICAFQPYVGAKTVIEAIANRTKSPWINVPDRYNHINQHHPKSGDSIHGIVSGFQTGSGNLQEYNYFVSDKGKVYTMKFVYPESEMKNDSPEAGYMAECYYRGFSKSNSKGHKIRSYKRSNY